MHRISALILVDPPKAVSTITEAFVKAACSRADAAKLLEVGMSAFSGWVRSLNLMDHFDQIEERALSEGWHWSAKDPSRLGGRPKGKTWSPGERRVRAKARKPPAKRATG